MVWPGQEQAPQHPDPTAAYENTHLGLKSLFLPGNRPVICPHPRDNDIDNEGQELQSH